MNYSKTVLLHDSHGQSTLRSDLQLVSAAQSGCQMAFGELWNLYSRRIYKTIVRITDNAQDAEDALQEAFFRAYLALETFEGRASFYTWMTRIAMNSALGILRKRRSHLETLLQPVYPENADAAPEEFRDLAPNPEQIFYQQEQHTKLMQAIHQLPKELREIIQIRVTEDCSIKEVAYRLNVSEAAARARLHRARVQLSTRTASRYRMKVGGSSSSLTQPLQR